jgi:hypothetical protein
MGSTRGPRAVLKLFTQRVARAVTRALLVVGLFLIYFLAVGPTALWVRLSPRWRRSVAPGGAGGAWAPAEGYGADLEDARRQS